MRAPDHHDAELVLKLYELRRDPAMREARDLLNSKFMPKSCEDIQAVAAPDHPMNRAYRQVSTYWEMAYGLIKHGTLDADLAMESNGEGFLLLAKVHPFLPQMREKMNPRSFLNAEWVATETEVGKRVFGMFQARIEKQRGQG